MPSAGPMFLQPFAPDQHLDELTSLYVPGIRIRVLRLDRIDPQVSGNKWFKLRYYLDDAQASGRGIVTWGGAWSNHILATAIACRRLGIPCTGIIRGEEPVTPSPVLITAAGAGMELLYISREAYSKKTLPELFDPARYIIVPEGGYDSTGAMGAATIHDFINNGGFTHIFCAVGTGTTMAGLVNGARHNQQVIGIPVLKNPNAGSAIEALLTASPADWQVIAGYEFGGYAKYNERLVSFMNSFYTLTGIPTDFVYTGKMFFAATELLRSGLAAQGADVLLVHSGGLAGNAGLPIKTLIF